MSWQTYRCWKINKQSHNNNLIVLRLNGMPQQHTVIMQEKLLLIQLLLCMSLRCHHTVRAYQNVQLAYWE